MVGQGSPSCRTTYQRLRLGAKWCLWLSALCLAGEVASGEEIDLAIRISWGGGRATPWSGTLSVSEGTIQVERLLGLEADAPGSLLNSDPSTLRLLARTARTYDGVDVIVRAPREAMLRTKYIAPGMKEAIETEVPLTKVVQETVTKHLDAFGNRIAFQRAPGDGLRIDLERDHLVFSSGEAFRFTIAPHEILSAASATNKLAMRMVSLTNGETVWQEDRDVALDERGSLAKPLEIEKALPDSEGVYELVVELQARRFGTSLIKPKVLAERRMQLMVMSETPPTTMESAGALAGEFDPAHPKWWDRMLRLPTMKIMPGIQRGPLGNEPTGTQEHLGVTWSTLKPSSWQAYPLPVLEVGTPHVLEIEYASDIAQALAVSIIEPNAMGQVAPLGLDAGLDVGEPAAGRQATIETYKLTFWPRTKSPLLMLANRRGDSMALFGKVRVRTLPVRVNHEILPITGRFRKRLVAAYFDKPFFPESFSVADSLDSKSGRQIEDWQTFSKGGTRLVDYLLASGRNAAVVASWCEGSTLYPSQLTSPTPKYDTGVYSENGNDPLRKDVVEMLLRDFDRSGLTFIPSLQFVAPLPELEQFKLTAAPREKLGIDLVGPDGRAWTEVNTPRRGVAPHYNLLDPRVQQAMRRVVLEVALRYNDHRSFGGIAISISGDGYAQLPDEAWGLDDVTLDRFATETSTILPAIDPRRPAVRWMVIQREAREAWLEWRAAQVTKFYSDLRADLTAIRPDMHLLLCPIDPLQSRRIQQKVRPSMPPGDRTLEGFLQAGIDPTALSAIPGVTFARSTHVEPSFLEGTDSLRAEMNISPRWDEAASDAIDPATIQLADALPLRLEAFDKISPFGAANTQTYLLTHLSPCGPESRRRFIHSLAVCDAKFMLDGGQMLLRGQEEMLAPLLSSISEIPNQPFETIPSRDDARTQPLVLRRWSDAQSTWLYAVNDSPWPVVGEVELESKEALQLLGVGFEVSGAERPDQSLSSTSGRVRWKFRLQPYDLIATEIPKANVNVSSWQTQVDRVVEVALRETIRETRLRANMLRTPAPLESLINGSFEQEVAADRSIPGWQISQGANMAANIDRKVGRTGSRSLHLVNSKPKESDVPPVAWVRSDEIPTPVTGRIALWVWLKVPDAKVQPKIRLAIEGRLDGQPYYRRANVGAADDGRSNQPLQENWSPFLFPVEDLPPVGLTELQVGIDLVGEGEVWIDDVQVFDLWFQENERDALLKNIALADFQLQSGKFADCHRFVEGYWPQFLKRNVPLDAPRVASLVERPQLKPPAAPPVEPAPSNGSLDQVRRWMPRMPFQRDKK